MCIVYTKVEQEKEHYLKLYRRLWLSRIDLTEAQEILDTILSLRLPYPRRKPPSALLNALTIALVISYSRPFVDSRGGVSVAERKLPGELLRFLTSKERRVHQAIIEIRNKEVAHSDADILELALRLYPDGDSCVCRSARVPFYRSELQVIRRMIDKILNGIEEKCKEIRKLLPLNVDL